MSGPTLATLGIKVENGDVLKATTSLDGMTVAGAKTARYFGRTTRGVLQSAIKTWTPEMRYRSPSLTLIEAQDWHACATAVFQETVHQMRLDGEL